MPLSPIREITEVEVRQLEPCLPVESRSVGLENGLNLNFNGVETQHATHSIHPYVAESTHRSPLRSSVITFQKARWFSIRFVAVAVSWWKQFFKAVGQSDATSIHWRFS